MASAHAESSRRQFLRECMLPALGGLAPGLAAPAPPAEERGVAGGGELLRLSRRAMGCRFEVILPAGERAAVEAAHEALDLVGDLERQMTIFRDDSELSRINRAAAARPVRVEPGLFDLLRAAAQLSAETGGAFDITAGPLSSLWRAARERGEPPAPDEVQGALARVGMGQVHLDAADCTVEFTRCGVQLDLSAIGKGYALDRVGELLASRRVGAALVHGGHSSVRAIGRPPWDEAWVISVQHPLRPGEAIATIRLRDQAMATSAVDRAVGDGRGFGHLTDPRTGWPARGLLGATVLVSDATRADALATAFCVMGSDGARAYCQEHPDTAALLVEEDEGEARPTAIGLAAGEVEVAR